MLRTVPFIRGGCSRCPLGLSALDQSIQGGSMRVDCSGAGLVARATQKAQALQHFVGFVQIPCLSIPQAGSVFVFLGAILNLRKISAAPIEKLRHSDTLDTDGFCHEWYCGIAFCVPPQGFAMLCGQLLDTYIGLLLSTMELDDMKQAYRRTQQTLAERRKLRLMRAPRCEQHFESVVQPALAFLGLGHMNS